MADRTGRFAIFEQLLADGVQYMFGNPGTSEQGFLDALSDYPQLTYILALQETIAVAMADGYARASQRPAIVQLHTGVGLGNAIGMVYQAYRGHSPLVMLAGEAGLRYDAMDAQMAADLVAMARPVTKWATRVVDPSSVLRVLRRAIKVATTPPKGPVFVALPLDVLDAPNDEEVVPTSLPLTRVGPEQETVDHIAGLLAAADCPIVIIGDGVAASGAQAELTRVAALVGAEVWGADSSEVNMDARHPQFQGLLGHMFGEQSRAVTQRADVVLVCGTYVFPEVFPALSGVFAPGARVVHVDLDPSQIAKNFPVDVGVVADPKVTLARIAAGLDRVMTATQKRTAATRAQAMADVKERLETAERAADLETADAVPMHAARFMEELSRKLPPDAIVFDEALTCSPDLNRYRPAVRPGHFFQTRGGSLGVGFPGAIGIKLSRPDQTVVGFSGDGGSMYTIQALWTAAHHGIGAKFVVCNNQSYRLLKLNIHAYWKERDLPEREFPASFDLHGPVIQFDAVARGLGINAVRVETPAQIGPAIDAALADDEPFLIDLVISGDVPDHVVHPRCGQ